MTVLEAIAARHSVRSYTDKPIEGETLKMLLAELESCNAESGLNIQLVLDEPRAFDSPMGHYGNFVGVRNYIALVGKRGKGLDEAVGYYGERLVIRAQQLGLNTCWVALSYAKGRCPVEIKKGELLRCVISIGYGATQGVPHKSKPLDSLCEVSGDMPDWFKNGMDAALLAPTAINQQQFHISYDGSFVRARAKAGPCSKIDLGIVKYHFEQGAGKDNFEWARG